MSSSNKVIWDAVHGQINVSNIVCKTILDNEYFQRLKRLEQTNTRPLYPCAHHDRFIHSLGTYHLGKIVFKAIKSNSEDHIKQYNSDLNIEYAMDWDLLKHEFELACLLHDVGHAPFSHTFEEFYNVDLKDKKSDPLDTYLLNEDKSYKFKTNNHLSAFESFRNDYRLLVKNTSGPKEHEKVSAFIVLTKFSKLLSDQFKADPFNISRMILGVKFKDAETEQQKIKEQVYNCFIELLNGQEIDVDKIDYLVRDQWATGNVFKNIDYNRLLNSCYILPDSRNKRLTLCFHKKAINEIIGLKEAKHSLVSNIHNHPVVKYDDYLLQKAVNESIKLELEGSELDKETIENYVANIVSVEALMEPMIFSNTRIFLPTDDDLIFFLKKHFQTSNYAKEWLSRSYKLKALWKSPFDFNHIFSDFTEFEHRIFCQKIKNFTQNYIDGSSYLNDGSLSRPFYIHNKNITNFSVFKLESDVEILINTESMEIEKLTNLLGDNIERQKEQKNTRKFFLLYLASPFLHKTRNKDIEQERDEFIPFLKKKVRSYISSMQDEIMSVVKTHPESKISELKDKFKEFKELESENDMADFEQTLLLFFTHLDEQKKISHAIIKDKEGNDVTPHAPKKRKYKLNAIKVSV
jgi:HD superfamily phosphohydrolase